MMRPQADQPWCSCTTLEEPLGAMIRSAQLDEPAPEHVHRLRLRVLPLLLATIPATAAGAWVVPTTVGVSLTVAIVGGAAWWQRSDAQDEIEVSSHSAPEGARVTSALEAPPSTDEPSVVPAPIDDVSRLDVAAPRATPRKTQARPNLRMEAALLERARAALEPTPTTALRIANQHRRRFPRSALAQEREILGLEALSRLGKGRGLRRRARLFLRRYPRSPYRERVHTLAQLE